MDMPGIPNFDQQGEMFLERSILIEKTERSDTTNLQSSI
ncbi:hypothetical protein D1AOALGA4SA_11087 [Olavius algarvensis Delta 1 endosymbiont]|nr:hypothetical protein D1AOALGA4SA_11087 [Olavius algarvensis Delta 1 endosymbiont]